MAYIATEDVPIAQAESFRIYTGRDEDGTLVAGVQLPTEGQLWPPPVVVTQPSS